MIKPYSERNPQYLSNESNQTIKKEPNKRNFPIYQKQKQKKSPIKPPKKLKTRELFKFLNIWDCEIGKRYDYLTQFNHYLISKKETIELEEIEKKMKKPDFVKFFKYLQEEKNDDEESSIQDHDVNLQIAFTAKQRREKNAQERKKPKVVYPHIKHKDVLLPASFNPKFEVPQPSPDDFVIVTHFYNSFLEQPSKNIPKSTIISGLLENRKFMAAYNMNRHIVEDQLYDFPTQFDEEITLEEFINFVLYPKILIIKEKEEKKYLPQVRGVLVFADEELNSLLKIYDEFNLDQEENVDPLKLISSLRTRYETRIKLFDTYLKFPEINKKITFEKWLYEFEVYCIQNSVNQLSKSFFKDWLNQLFEIPNKFVILQTYQISKRQKYDKLYENDKIYLPSKFFSLLESIFTQVRKSNLRFSEKKLVVDNLFANQDLIQQYGKKKVRNQKTNQLPVETVEDTLNRILLESEEYIDLDELIDFFTIRGRPLVLSLELKKQHNLDTKKKQPLDENQFGAINKIENGFFLITIPNSNVEENKGKSIRQQKIEKMLVDKEKEILKEMNTKFQAHPVPWYVKEPLYDQFNREREERRQLIKEESKAALMQSLMEPKNFEKQKKQIQPEPEIKFKFLSRPVPDSTNESKFKEIMEKQRSRSKSNVDKKKAEWSDYFANSSQVQSWEERQEIAKNKKRTENKNSYKEKVFGKFRAKSLPNFERLHTIFENIIAQRKKGFVPTVPCQTNLSITNRTVDCSMLDLGNQSTQMVQQKIADIDQRLKNILKSRGPNIIKTKSLSALSTLRRKQRYDKEHNQKVINDELEQWRNERKQLLPKGMIISNPAMEQQKVLDKELEDLVKWKKKYHKNLDEDYQKDLKRMQKRVQKRKLLRFQNNEDYDQEESGSQSSKPSETQNRNAIDEFL